MPVGLRPSGVRSRMTERKRRLGKTRVSTSIPLIGFVPTSSRRRRFAALAASIAAVLGLATGGGSHGSPKRSLADSLRAAGYDDQAIALLGERRPAHDRVRTKYSSTEVISFTRLHIDTRAAAGVIAHLEVLAAQRKSIRFAPYGDGRLMSFHLRPRPSRNAVVVITAGDLPEWSKGHVAEQGASGITRSEGGTTPVSLIRLSRGKADAADANRLFAVEACQRAMAVIPDDESGQHYASLDDAGQEDFCNSLGRMIAALQMNAPYVRTHVSVHSVPEVLEALPADVLAFPSLPSAPVFT